MSLEKAIAIAFCLILENDFRALLNQLGLDISKERVAKLWRQAYRLGSYFVGLEIRTAEDDSPSLITGNSEVIISASPKPKNTNVITKLWTMVMNKVIPNLDFWIC